MDIMTKLKLKKNIKGMKDTSVQCIELLNHIEKEVPLTEDMKRAFYNVVKHNRNILTFFGVLEQQLEKK
ncbi:hypothetical protein ACFWMP_26090 [Paenibacillus sp. NPDC058367]|uniref:hypothetical protein n=1 Tax=Paenibacillus sp. NPDC058367 TaxID=3346460 RepID=UPI00364F235E